MSSAAPITVESTLRTALDRGGRVIIPPGTHEIRDTLVLRPGVTALVSEEGREQTILVWKGPADRPAIHVDKGLWNCDVGGFHIRNGGSIGKGVGLSACQRERPASYVGTVCGSNRYENIGVEGFDVGVCLGDTGLSCTSENRFRCLSLYDCTTGVALAGYDTLNNHFEDLYVSNGDTGLICLNGGGETHVSGGSASNVGRPETNHFQKSVFSFSSGGNYSVRGYRQGEGGTATFLKASGSHTMVAVESCTVLGTHPLDGRVIEAYYDSILSVRSCMIDGHVLTGALSGSVLVEQCETLQKGRTKLVDAVNPQKGKAYRVQERGCIRYDAEKGMVRLRDYTTNVTK